MKDTARTKTSREAILEAVERLLANRGYKKMTIDDLAREVGIGKGSIYLHFSSKEEIALSHIDRIIERLKRRLQDIALRPISTDERIRLMVLERVMFRFDSVQNYTQSLDELLTNLRSKLLERRRRHFEQEAAIFSGVIKEGISKRELSAGNADEAARAIIDATNSLLPYSLSIYELSERSEVERKADRVAALIISGLRHP